MEDGSGGCYPAAASLLLTLTLTVNRLFLSIDSPYIQWSWRKPYHGVLTPSMEARQGTVSEARDILYPHLLWTCGRARKGLYTGRLLHSVITLRLENTCLPQMQQELKICTLSSKVQSCGHRVLPILWAILPSLPLGIMHACDPSWKLLPFLSVASVFQGIPSAPTRPQKPSRGEKSSIWNITVSSEVLRV